MKKVTSGAPRSKLSKFITATLMTSLTCLALFSCGNPEEKEEMTVELLGKWGGTVDDGRADSNLSDEKPILNFFKDMSFTYKDSETSANGVFEVLAATAIKFKTEKSNSPIFIADQSMVMDVKEGAGGSIEFSNKDYRFFLKKTKDQPLDNDNDKIDLPISGYFKEARCRFIYRQRTWDFSFKNKKSFSIKITGADDDYQITGSLEFVDSVTAKLDVEKSNLNGIKYKNIFVKAIGSNASSVQIRDAKNKLEHPEQICKQI